MNSIQDELRKPAHYLSMRKREQAANYIDKLQAELNAALTAAQPASYHDEPVAEIIECQIMGGPTLREIEGRWKFLRNGEMLYTRPPAQPAALPSQTAHSEWLQESSYRAGAKAGYNLGIGENHQGLADLLAAHQYPKPVAQPAALPAVTETRPYSFACARTFNPTIMTVVTVEMVEAYLTEQRRVVEEADKFGRPNAGGLHTNTVKEACRSGIEAALAAITQPAALPVPLTDEQIEDLANQTQTGSWRDFARAIEAAHGITAPEVK